MAEGCTHNCSTCSKTDCASKNQIVKEKLNERSTVKHVIGVVSGKGGVGKSLVTGMLSVLMQRMGLKTAIIDADITGPSIPKMFGVNADVNGDEKGLVVPVSSTGIEMISANLLLQDETQPVIWRGPVIAGMVKQFWSDVIWNDIDVMFIDCPPGTGDVPLTVFQSIPLDGIVIVSSPQDLVSMIVSKAVNMASMMNIPVLGLVENMSYAICPDCGKHIEIYGKSHIEEVANHFGLKVLGRIPFDPLLAELCDKGQIEMLHSEALDEAANEIAKSFNKA
jgi:Mrp family chromosome partitioning ATPase